MFYWNKILKSNVVNTFRDASHKWWGMDIHFYDEYGNYKNNGIPFQNPFCRLIQSRPKEAKNCLLFRKENLKGLNKSYKIFTCKCHAGLQNIVVPIFVKGDRIGALIGSGMQVHISNDQKEKDIVGLTGRGFDKMELKKCYNRMKVVNSYTKAHILDFMKLIATDVEAFYEMLYENEEIKKKQKILLRKKKNYNGKYKGIIGASQAMENVFDTLELIKNTESPVLIEGESGAGKELIAAAIHYDSFRKNKVFIIQNCSIFSDTLLSSELFGHEKGSFTGAVLEKKGLFEIADGGTLFLDEVGDMSRDAQGGLLRVLENGTFYRVGGIEQRRVDVRIIAATNKELKKQVEKGLFRKDLFYRINTLHINIPPLRDRKEDILPLFHHFLESYTKIRNVEKKEINSEVFKLLVNHNWPGNIRELKNLVERLIALSGKSETIEPEHLSMEILANSSSNTSAENRNKDNSNLKHSLQFLEKNIIKEVLKRVKCNKTITSRELGISRATLNNKIEKFSINLNSLSAAGHSDTASQ